ncbi:MAG: M48 family metallopeptidase [Flavobacteriales bacterium]|nr:M48 family metallopeptidase [Flavobacteriales bacterium]
MKKTYRVLLALFIVVYAISCARVPFTGRKQANLVAESEMILMSDTAYNGFLAQSKVLPANDNRTQMVRQIGVRIKDAVVKYLGDNGESNRVEGFNWEFNVVDADDINAWCMPGGKVVVYTGILPVTKDEASLAVVMGHEIAHAVARHGNERMSNGLLINLGLSSVSIAMGQNPTLTQQIFLQSIGIGSELGMLSFSRKHETEADKLGLVFMAMAGYDPQVAVSFWERMSASSGGAAPPEWLSTHPSHETRVNDLKKFMPKALEYYKKP